MLTKPEVIKRFCTLATKVGDVQFKHKCAHDCFCEDSYQPIPYSDNFQFEEEVLLWIEDVVNNKLGE